MTATLDESGDRLTVFAVNRHLERDIPAEIGLSGFEPAPQARVETLAAASIYQVNDEVRPEAVLPVPDRTAIPLRFSARCGYGVAA